VSFVAAATTPFSRDAQPSAVAFDDPDQSAGHSFHTKNDGCLVNLRPDWFPATQCARFSKCGNIHITASIADSWRCGARFAAN
jgi:hypothetical protein